MQHQAAQLRYSQPLIIIETLKRHRGLESLIAHRNYSMNRESKQIILHIISNILSFMR